MSLFSNILARDRIVDLIGTSKNEILKELVEAIAKSEHVQNKEEFLEKIMEREGILSTGIGIGVAIPHAKIGSVTDFVLAIGRSKKGVDFDSIDKRPVFLIFMIGGPDNKQHEYLKLLAKISIVIKQNDIKEQMMKAKEIKQIYDILIDA